MDSPAKPDRRRRYEQAGKRPGAPVATRLTPEQLALLDARLEPDQSRSAYLNALLLKAIGWNEPKRKGRKR